MSLQPLRLAAQQIQARHKVGQRRAQFVRGNGDKTVALFL
jgi:hypothetical protein